MGFFHMKHLIAAVLFAAAAAASAHADTLTCFDAKGFLQITKTSPTTASVTVDFDAKDDGNITSLIKNFPLEADDGGNYDDSTALGPAEYVGFATPISQPSLPKVKVNVIRHLKGSQRIQVAFSMNNGGISLPLNDCVQAESIKERFGYSNATLVLPK